MTVRAALSLGAVLAAAPGCFLSHAAEDDGPPVLDDPPGIGDEPPPVIDPPVIDDPPPDDPPPPPPPPPEDPDDVRDVCETGERLTVDVPVMLPGNTLRWCPWGEGDNLLAQQEIATARIEDTSARIVPEDAVLCDIELDFRVDDAFRYDDNFFLLFGESVLAASDRSLVDRLPSSGVVRRWDWGRVRGRRMLVMGSAPYCVGEDEGLADCTLPDSDFSDRLSLAFDQEIIDELSFLAFEAGRADFTVIAVGDNDGPTDCQYSPLSIDAVVTYVRTE